MISDANISIDQFLAGFSPYDAISNEALIMRDVLREMGFRSEIYAEHRHPSVVDLAKSHFEYRPSSQIENIVIFHFSIGSALTAYLATQSIRLIVRYHNVTPPEFFTLPSDKNAYHAALLGRKQLVVLDQIAECVLADSEFNLQDFGKKNGRIEAVVPILRDYSKLMSLRDDANLIDFLKKSNRKNWLFVGRIAPNKAQHDLIETLKIYQEVVDKNVRLVLIGSFFSLDYKNLLFKFCENLGLQYKIGLNEATDETDVLFLPNASDEMLRTAYKSCDLFLCLSDHEGFCVPIVEALTAGLPVIAFDGTAVGETGRPSAKIIDKGNISETIETLIACMKDTRSYEPTVDTEKKQLTSVKSEFSSLIREFVSNLSR